MGHLAKPRDASFFSCIFQPVPLWCAYNSLCISTNLMNGTELLLSYRVGEKPERTKRLTVIDQQCLEEIVSESSDNKVVGTVIMPVAIVQPTKIMDLYGIEYERIKGDFIRRSNDEPMVVGSKKFEFEIK